MNDSLHFEERFIFVNHYSFPCKDTKAYPPHSHHGGVIPFLVSAAKGAALESLSLFPTAWLAGLGFSVGQTLAGILGSAHHWECWDELFPHEERSRHYWHRGESVFLSCD